MCQREFKPVFENLGSLDEIVCWKFSWYIKNVKLNFRRRKCQGAVESVKLLISALPGIVKCTICP